MICFVKKEFFFFKKKKYIYLSKSEEPTVLQNKKNEVSVKFVKIIKKNNKKIYNITLYRVVSDRNSTR
jgi:hypothetical protein